MNILIIGSYGLGNVGDNACRDVLSDFVKREKVALKCYHPPVKQDLIGWADMVILGGGGLLYDSGEVISLRGSNAVYCNRLLRSLFLVPEIQRLVQCRLIRGILNTLPFVTTKATAIVDNYMNPIEIAFNLGKLTAGIALGTQGICTEYGKRRYAQTLSKLDLLTVRDPVDKVLLEAIGVSPKGGIEVCEDLGWLVKPPEVIAPEFDIGWILRWLSDPIEKYYLPVKSTIKRLQSTGFSQCIISFSRTDTHFLKQIAKEADIPFFEDLDENTSIGELAKCRLIVSNRFHAVLFSLLCRKPIIVPTTRYSSKSEWLLARANLPYSFSTNPLVLEDKIIEVWQKKVTLQVDVSGFINKARESLALLGKLIQNRRTDVKRPD